MGTEPALISIKNLTIKDIRMGNSILQDISITLGKKEFVCLSGPSGSGKSTLALSMMNLLPSNLDITGGQIKLGGLDITRATTKQMANIRGSLVSILFQDALASLNPVFPCGKQVEEPLRLHTKLKASKRRNMTLSIFQQLGFHDPDRIYSSFPSELSGGERQRVMLGMSIILKPRLLIADEPTSALDQASAKLLFDLFDKLHKKEDMSLLLISHDLDLPQKYASRIITISNGSLTGDTALDKKPGHLFMPLDSKKAPNRMPTSESPLLKVESLVKTYETKNAITGRLGHFAAINNLSFNMEHGEILGVTGVSGAGKTTLGRCVAGLEKPDSGKIFLKGKPTPLVSPGIWHWHQTPHPVQVIYQSPFASLNPLVKIGKIIENALYPLNLTKKERKDRAISLLKEFGLPPAYYYRYPRELSGGENQRVAIARCLATRPLLLIADEPTASLDEKNKGQILDIMQRLTANENLSIILISHDLRSVSRICTSILNVGKP